MIIFLNSFYNLKNVVTEWRRASERSLTSRGKNSTNISRSIQRRWPVQVRFILIWKQFCYKNSLLGRTNDELKSIHRQEAQKLSKNQDELKFLENFVKLRQKGPEEKLQNETLKYRDAKAGFWSFMCTLNYYLSLQ